MTFSRYIAAISSFLLLGAGVLQVQHMHMPQTAEAVHHEGAQYAHTYHADMHDNDDDSEHAEREANCDICQTVAASNAMITEELVLGNILGGMRHALQLHEALITSGNPSAYRGRAPPAYV